MAYKKRGSETTVREVVERNTGIPIDEFLNPEGKPYIKNIEKAIDFFKKNENEKITIVGDYDFDGVSASTIMYLGLRRYGLNPVVRIPKRFSEGYGLSEKIIDEIKEGLVITVDNGIASNQAIKKAKEKGLKVIITDHHLPAVNSDGEMVLPEADIIVDPWSENESEYKGYCGAGLAYRFIDELLPGRNKDDLLTLAAIATVADVMDLTSANWLLVRKGIKLINEGKSIPAINEIMKQNGMGNHVDEGTFGFQFGPLGNAAGRLDDIGALNVFKTFITPADDERLPNRVKWLIQINDKRKRIVKDAINNINTCERRFIDKTDPGKAPIVVYHPTWGEGIIGLIAGELCEKYHCPVVAFTKSGSGLLKGSGRSPEGIHLKKALDICKDHLVGYGGHEGAAGMSMKEESLEDFYEAFKRACGEIPDKPEPQYDLPLTKDIGQIINDLKECAPYGKGNPSPIFRFNFNINEIRKIGNGEHLSIKGSLFDIVGFDMWEKYEKLGKPGKIEALGSLNESWFRGKMTPKIELIDFCARE